MKVNRKKLIKGLEVVSSVCEKRNTMPILSNVLFTGISNCLQLTGTDLEVSTKHDIKVDETLGYSFAADPKKLIKVLKTFTDDLIDLIKDDEGIVIFRSGKCDYRPELLPVDDFPETPENNDVKGLSVNPGADWQEAINKTLPTISKDTTRINLSGIYVEPTDDVLTRFVSTDGHRLAYIDKLIEVKSADPFIIPLSGLKAFLAIFKKLKPQAVVSGKDGNFFYFTFENTTISVRLVDSIFPNYRQVIPENNNNLFTFNKKELVTALNRFKAINSEKYKGVRFTFNDGLVTVSDSKKTMIQELEEVSGESAGLLEIGLNVVYLLEFLALTGSETLNMALKNEACAALLTLTDDDLIGVVMPMKL
jgi:DNA polymerase-3 subunit beta